MKIPANLKILGHNYTVKIDPVSARHTHNTSGTCCSSTQEIELDSNAPESSQAETLLHEIFEALKYHLDMSDVLKHDTLSQLSECLFCVMRDNELNFCAPVKSGGVKICPKPGP
jgi:hypothetical protein